MVIIEDEEVAIKRIIDIIKKGKVISMNRKEKEIMSDSIYITCHE